jgi:osmotically inducible protein OsmC
MAVRTSTAVWEGRLKDGNGTISLGSGAFEAPYSFTSRFEQGAGTNPEELIAAAHAGCFSMALSHGLAEAGHAPIRVSTTARVHLEKDATGFSIPTIDLECEADVPVIEEEEFHKLADDAKENCPVSRLLKGSATITLKARLLR